MPESRISPISLTERIGVLDVLRGLAVSGILIGNMQWFSGYGLVPQTLAGQETVVNQIGHFLVHFLVEGKFYSIFSFLFGFGFALQIARAEERGDHRASVFKRRLFWLLVIGLLHAFLLWSGDILSVYALLGFLLILFRKKATEKLLKWAVALTAVPVLTYILMYVLFVAFASPETVNMVDRAQNEMWNNAVSTVPHGSYLQILRDYNLNMLAGRYAGLIVQMRLPKILAMFLLGFYAYKRGFFQDPSSHRPFIRRVLAYGLLIGIPANIVFAYFSHSEADFPPTPAGMAGVAAYAIGVPALALGIIALVVTLWQNAIWQRLLVILAPVGIMALTNYLLQTAICVTIFYGFGLGLYGSIGAAKATAMALAIFTFQVLLSTLWLKYFAYGPMEWIWRQLTYRKRLGLRIAKVEA
jgi:uncharacterized protein